MSLHWIGGIRVLSSEPDARKRALAVWLAHHPAEKAALADHGLLDILSVAWADCWHEAAWDTTRRHDQLGLYLSEVCARLQEVAQGLEDDAARRRIEAEAENGSAYWPSSDSSDKGAVL